MVFNKISTSLIMTRRGATAAEQMPNPRLAGTAGLRPWSFVAQLYVVGAGAPPLCNFS